MRRAPSVGIVPDGLPLLCGCRLRGLTKVDQGASGLADVVDKAAQRRHAQSTFGGPHQVHEQVSVKARTRSE